MNERILNLEPRFGGIEFEVSSKGTRGISNSDVLPQFDLIDAGKCSLKVTIFEASEQISKRKGWGWIHTNFVCEHAEKQRKHYSELYTKIETAITENEKEKARKARDKYAKKMCKNHNTRYDCSHPCEKCLDFSKDRTVTKINGNIFFRNGYGQHSLDFVYFAILKNVEGEHMLYVRRRPANAEFLDMSAQDYQKNYVQKNKHIKNSFCICVYKSPKLLEKERILNLESNNLPAIIPQPQLPVVVA